MPELEAAVAAEPLRERLWGGLMLALYRCGRQADALRAFARARETLADEVGLDPGPALRDLEARILGQDPTLSAPGRPRASRIAADPSDEADRPGHRAGDLRRRPGRGRAPAHADRPRWVGKTRLALAVAQEVAGGGPGRVDVRFVGLDTVGDADQLLAAVATDLGLGSDAGGGDPVGALAAALAGRPTLLVLDNCEQVVEAGDRRRDAAGPAPRCACSRPAATPSRLRASARCGAAARLPEPVAADLRALLAFDAVALFVERAAAAAPDFVLTPRHPPCAEICRRLDGIPLAIELAAARLRVLPPADLAPGSTSALRVLTGGGPRPAPRQRTLRATLEWSYDLLSPASRPSWPGSVFPGGFSLEAAEAVCGADVLDDLAALVDSSLVRARAGQAVRFRLPETVRAYAVEQLDRLPDAASVRAAHAAQVLQTVRRTAPGIDGPDAHRCLVVLTDACPTCARPWSGPACPPPRWLPGSPPACASTGW